MARSFFGRGGLDGNPAYAAHFHAMLTGADPRRLGAAVRSVLLGGTPLRARLHRIAAPTLVIAGVEDALYPLATLQSAARALPQGQFLAVPGQHIAPVACPGVVADALRAFLARTAP